MTMGILARSALLVGGLLGLAAPANGQVLDTFDTKANGACPTEQQIEQANGRYTGQTGAGWTFVIAPQPVAYRSSLPASESSQVLPAIFAKVRLYGISRDNRRVLVGWYRGSSSDRLCAWLNVADLLIRSTSADPLKVLADGPHVLQVKDVSSADKRNTVRVKAVLSNLNIAGDAGIAAYVAPNDSKAHVQLRLFEHFSVYDRKRGTPRGNDDIYYLLGKSERQQEELLGWVHADDVYLWNTRMAAFWTGKGHGRGWAREDMTGPPLVSEEKFTEQHGHAQSRFPVLAMKPGPDQVQGAANRLVGADRTSINLSRLVEKYQIVLPGKSCRPGTQDCLSAEETEKARRELQARIDSQRRIDILFLIDATESMDVYFASTAAAIRRFAQTELMSINREASLSLRVSVAAYGDYKDLAANPATVDYEKIVEFHDIGLGDERRLAPMEEYARRRYPPGQAVQLDRHKDKLEAPFAGLIRSVGDARWRADAGFRFVIHLADHGNRELNKASGEKDSTLVETVGIDAVAEALKAQRIIYLPISVLGRANETDNFARDARRAFIRQSGQLLEMRSLAPQGQGESKVTLSYRDASTQESPAERQEAVLKAIRTAAGALLQANRSAALKELCARSAQNPACDELRQLERRDDVVSRINAVSAEEQGLTREQFDNVHSRSQTVTYAWVRPVDPPSGQGQETLTYWVAIDRDRLRQMREGFNQLCALVKPDSGDITARIREIITNVVRIETGDPDADLPSSQTLAKALSLPFWERTEMLSLPIGTIAKNVQSNIASEIYKLRGGFCRSEVLLSLVERRLMIEDPAKIPVGPDGLAQNPPRNLLREYDWFVKTDRGEGFFYIPVSYLP